MPAYYSLKNGWASSYPETTGYIIPTMFKASYYFESENLKNRAVLMSDWLLTLQMENGAFPGGLIKDEPKSAIQRIDLITCELTQNIAKRLK